MLVVVAQMQILESQQAKMKNYRQTQACAERSWHQVNAETRRQKQETRQNVNDEYGPNDRE